MQYLMLRGIRVLFIVIALYTAYCREVLHFCKVYTQIACVAHTTWKPPLTLNERKNCKRWSGVAFLDWPEPHNVQVLDELFSMHRVIEEQQSEWKRHRWQKMNTKFLRDETNKQLEVVKGQPEDVFTWDVFTGLYESITNIQVSRSLYESITNIQVSRSLYEYHQHLHPGQ